jgi:hypothetical protein
MSSRGSIHVAASDNSLYRELLRATDQKVWDAASGGLDLSEEIRLVRTLVAIWARNPLRNAGTINAALTILARAVYIQARTNGAVSDIEQQLQDAAESVLNLQALDAV